MTAMLKKYKLFAIITDHNRVEDAAKKKNHVDVSLTILTLHHHNVVHFRILTILTTGQNFLHTALK